ncbi:hypothetical protein [Eggerthia catenaformis]|uniref:hypothetical protein n=1 Tax=Eggerthia catenaformis TaxID=31973 RepID=UPI003C7008F6
MNIRRVKKKNTGKVLKLLSEVLDIHSRSCPDISGTTKYTSDQLIEKFNDDTKRDEEWLLKEMEKQGVSKYSEIFLGEYVDSKLTLILYH